MGCRCAIVSQMLYHRCLAGKPVACKFSTRFLFCEGCCLVVRIVIYVLLTGFGFLLLHSGLADGAGRWTVNTSELFVIKCFVILLWKATGALFQYSGNQSCSHTLSRLLSPSPPPAPHPISSTFKGEWSRCIYHLGGSLHSTQRSSHCSGLVILAAKHLAKTCSKSSKFQLLTFHWDGLRKYVLFLFFKKSQT